MTHVGRSRHSDFKCFLYILIKEGEFLVNVFCRCCPAELTKSFSFFQWSWGKAMVRIKIFVFVSSVLTDLTVLK